MITDIMAVVEFLLPYLLPVGLVLFCMSLWQFYVNSTRDVSSALPLPPGSVGLPFVGETLSMAFKGFTFYREKREKHGRVYKTHILGKPTIRVWGSENIRKILKNEEILVTMNWPTSVREIMGKGALINSTRRLHLNRRGAMLRAFTNTAINGYTAGIESLVAKTIRSWCNRGKIMAQEESRKLAFEATARMLLGCDFSQQQMTSMMANMSTMVENFFTLPIDIPGFGFHKALKARGELLKTLDEIIVQKSDSESSIDAVSILKDQVKDGSLTSDELKDSIIEMLFSAFHGITSLCCSALTELARNPEVTDRLAQDMQKADLLQNGNLTMDSLSKLPYLQQVCKELLRFAPPYGGGFRHVLKTFELEGYQIPKGWTILYSIRDNHEVEENFKAAREFNADRWVKDMPADSYIPFGGSGIRSCIGEKYVMMFIQIFICQVVRGCRWELVDPNTTFTHFPVQQPTNGLPLVFNSDYRKATSC